MYKRQVDGPLAAVRGVRPSELEYPAPVESLREVWVAVRACLLYTSDAADDLLCVDIGGRRSIKKKKKNKNLIFS